ncbi:MAG: YifB family Mg chelatase-like AAA ATPase [Propionibacteriaceae bacterium]|jgi:magnesium chelatase family protein|nr:YifB family Mg chelatase-like AAA ATPase [Propionibacteriaceae bacterium]
MPAQLAKAWSVALVGLSGAMVEVEAAVSSGLRGTIVVGLPDTAVTEARDRCRAAMQVTDLGWPEGRVTFNLSPANLPKAGTHFDLAMVAAVGATQRLCRQEALRQVMLFGEVGLDGQVRPARGLLPALLEAVRHGFTKVIVPTAQLREAMLIDGVEVTGVSRIERLFAVLNGGNGDEPPPPTPVAPRSKPLPDMADVAGQFEAKWALEVAAAGRHHVYFHGPPGVGKTLLAERLPTLLPDLSPAESREVSSIHSLAGRPLSDLITRPPFSAPHHSASLPAVVGGGAKIANPGAISMAHRGVLFLDEAPEFSARTLDSLRVPLESGKVTISRAYAVTVFPAAFQLVLAANPCPCGNADTPGQECKCTPFTVRRYASRVSGPILDRVDIRQQLQPLQRSFLSRTHAVGESSAQIAERVAAARERQAARLAEVGFQVNGEVPGVVLRKQLPLPDGIELLEAAVAQGRLSARGVDKVLRLAWTICDIAGSAKPSQDQLHAALAMRRGSERC